MARNGSGVYTNPYPDFTSGTVISSSETDANNAAMATAITQSIAVDGQTTITANIPMANFKFTGLGTGSASTDSVNKAQMDAAIATVAAGLFWKDPCLVASTGNLTLSGEQTIDGVLTSGSRVLVKDQTATEENGIYVTGAGAWTRATDMDAWAEFVSAAVIISEGTANADTQWNCTVDDGGTLDTTSITWAQWGAIVVAGTGLTKSGVTMSIDTGGVGLTQIATAAKTESIAIACSDETTALVTGTAKATFRMPYAFTLTDVRASVTTAPTDAVLTVDINEGGTTILSTKLTIDATEKTSTTAATPAVISDSALADDAEITIDIDQIGSTVAGAGLKVYLIGYKAA
jgi:hypothetical protein